MINDWTKKPNGISCMVSLGWVCKTQEIQIQITTPEKRIIKLKKSNRIIAIGRPTCV